LVEKKIANLDVYKENLKKIAKENGTQRYYTWIVGVINSADKSPSIRIPLTHG